MLNIENLRLFLPHQYQHRAALIARSVANELANMPQKHNQSLSIEKLSLAPMKFNPAHNDQQLAVHIARHISHHISKYQSGQIKKTNHHQITATGKKGTARKL